MAAFTATVTNGNASGPGSFAQAVADMNANADPNAQNFIKFALPVTGGYATVAMGALLSLTAINVLIDGWTLPGSGQGIAPLLVLDGAAIPAQANVLGTAALNLNGKTQAVRGVAFINMPSCAIISIAQGWNVYGCRFGTRDGITAAPIKGHAINYLAGSDTGTIGGIYAGTGNQFVCCGDSVNVSSGVASTSSGRYAKIFGNIFGVTSAAGAMFGVAAQSGSAILANPNLVGTAIAGSSFSSSALKLFASPSLAVGGRNALLKNRICGGGVYGLEVDNPASVPLNIVGNDVGCDETGLIALANVRTGVIVFNSCYATITYNRIKFNTRSGVGLDSSTPGNAQMPVLSDNFTSKGFGRGSVVAFNIIDDNGQSGVYVAQGQDHIIHDNQMCGNRDGFLTLGRVSANPGSSSPADPTFPLLFPKVIIRRVWLYGNYIGVEKGGSFDNGYTIYAGTPHANFRNGLFLSNAYQVLVGNSLRYLGQNVIQYNGIGGSGWGIRAQGVGSTTHTFVAGGNIISNNVTADISISIAADNSSSA